MTTTACGKIRYSSKTKAKQARKRIGDMTLRPYRCPLCEIEAWHLGHLPSGIINGRTTRADVYGADVSP